LILKYNSSIIIIDIYIIIRNMLVNILVLLSLLSLTLGFVHNGHNSIRSLRSSLIMKDAKYQLVLLRHGIIFI